MNVKKTISCKKIDVINDKEKLLIVIIMKLVKILVMNVYLVIM